LATEVSDNPLKDLVVDKDNLYIEDMVTDLRAGSIRRLTPISPDGSPDAERETLFFGQAQLMSQMGPLPLQFALEADNLEDAIDLFPGAAEVAVQKMLEEIKELQRQQASQIVVPGSMPGGGMPGPGGGIQLR
jgi:hypothetical protein